jgi:23S rRNA U2552 (ribose-2'-O)-methylase RlmE/FtsJ
MEAITDFLTTMPKLKVLELQGPIHKKSKRDELRIMAKGHEVDLILTN